MVAALCYDRRAHPLPASTTVELGNQLILLGAFLLLLSIFVGLVSSRIGAPLLLAFLALGIFFGEDGPGGIFFDNYFAAYTIGSIALAIILFDGGLRTGFASFRSAADRPASPQTMAAMLSASTLAQSNAGPAANATSQAPTRTAIAHRVGSGRRADCMPGGLALRSVAPTRWPGAGPNGKAPRAHDRAADLN